MEHTHSHKSIKSEWYTFTNSVAPMLMDNWNHIRDGNVFSKY